MNGLIHRAAGNDMEDEGNALEWLDQPDRPDLGLTVTPQKNTALHIAVRFNQEDLATKIIELCPTLLYKPNSKGDIPLHIAAKAGHLHLARLLASEAGAPGDLEEGTSQRVLGEMLRMTNLEGNSPLHEALKMGHRKTALCLLDLDEEQELGAIVNHARESPLYLAVGAKSKSVVLKLLERRDCSIEGPDGQTPLHIAVINGHSERGLEIVKILLSQFERGDIERVDRFGKTALHYAATLGRRTNLVALFLIKKRLKSNGAVNSPLAWVKKMSLGRRGRKYLSNSDLRSLANTLSVVATLIATVTFAAAFTFPGGYKNNDPGEGLPVFIKRAALKAFVLSDTLAFCCSLIVAFLLIYTMAGDRAFLVGAVNVSIILLWVAVSGTVVALASALYVVLSDESLWLAIAVTCVGCSVPLLVYVALCFSSSYTPSSFKKLRDKM